MAAHQGAFRERVARVVNRVGTQAEWGSGALAKTFWEHTIRDEGDFTRHVDYIHSIRLGMPWCGASATGRIPRFTAMCARACYRMTGRGTPVATKVISANGCGDRMQRIARMSDMRDRYHTDNDRRSRMSLRSSGLRKKKRRARRGAPSLRKLGSTDQLVGRAKLGYFSLPSAILAGHTVTCLPSCHWKIIPLILSGPNLRPWVNWSPRP
jgi:hypothetical protein